MADVEMTEFFNISLKLETGWNTYNVEQDVERKRITAFINFDKIVCKCQKCGIAIENFQTKLKTLQDLDFCSFETFLIINYPIIKCKNHGFFPLSHIL